MEVKIFSTGDHLVSPSPAVRKNGGARPGAGRKKGTVARRIRKIRDMTESAIEKIRKVPLEVMLKNMDRFDREADVMYAKLNDMVDNCRPPKNAPLEVHKEFLREVKDLMAKMRDCRMDAQKCAVDAAPFMHSRRAQVTIKDETKTITAKPETQQSEEELADYFSKLRTRPATVEPLIIDNETGAPMAPVNEYEYE
jgi:hypothetical protein